MDDDAPRPTAGPVVAAIALGVAPLPLLAVYSVLFIAHGSIHPVVPPDITTTRHGELLAGIIALVLFVLMTLTLMWFLNRRRRWPFALGQLATLVTAVDFVIDSTTGPPGIPVMLALTSAIAFVISLRPVSGVHVDSPILGRRREPAPTEHASTP
jgi:hypothetical protein